MLPSLMGVLAPAIVIAVAYRLVLRGRRPRWSRLSTPISSMDSPVLAVMLTIVSDTWLLVPVGKGVGGAYGMELLLLALMVMVLLLVVARATTMLALSLIGLLGQLYAIAGQYGAGTAFLATGLAVLFTAAYVLARVLRG